MSDAIELHELAPRVYWSAPDHASDRPALGAIAGDDATLMVDAGASVRHARAFLDALAAKAVPPVRHVVLTHAHWDHVFGAPAIEGELIATEATRELVAAMASYEWTDAALDERVADGREIVFCRDMIKAELGPAERAELTLRVPERSFDTELEVDLGQRPVRIIHVGGDHASDSGVVVVPGVVAFLGDCLYRNLHVEPNYLTRRHLFPLLDRLLALEVEHYVLGHDDAPLPRAEFEAKAQLMKAVGNAVRDEQMNGGAIAEARGDGGGAYTKEELTEYVKAFRSGLPREMPTPDALITFLPVRDLDATHRFYHDVLGLPLVLDQGACRIYRVAGGGFVGFCRRDDAAAAPGVIVTLVTPDVDGWHQRLVANGAETDGPPRDNPVYGIHHFYARDPDGWAVEVQRFHDPAWSTPASTEGPP